MKHSFTAVVSAALVIAALDACGPDPLLGSASYTSSATDTITQPSNDVGTVTENGMGTLTISAGSAGAYTTLVLDAHPSSEPCSLDGTRSGDVITITPSQMCQFHFEGNPLDATITSGTITLGGGSPNTVVLQLAYDFVIPGMVAGLSGHGTRTLTATMPFH